jgi:hypothetical protein
VHVNTIVYTNDSLTWHVVNDQNISQRRVANGYNEIRRAIPPTLDGSAN